MRSKILLSGSLQVATHPKAGIARITRGNLARALVSLYRRQRDQWNFPEYRSMFVPTNSFARFSGRRLQLEN
jgi:hypothetical protein